MGQRSLLAESSQSEVEFAPDEVGPFFEQFRARVSVLPRSFSDLGLRAHSGSDGPVSRVGDDGYRHLATTSVPRVLARG